MLSGILLSSYAAGRWHQRLSTRNDRIRERLPALEH